MIDSFAQTDTQNILSLSPQNLIDCPDNNILLDTATGGTASSDMVDSGVDSQGKIFKERNVSLTEDDECLSFTEDRFAERHNMMSEDYGVSTAVEVKRDDNEEVSFD